MTAPAAPDVAAAIRDLAAIIARLNLRLDAIAADVALLRSMADAERQADGRASFPAPAGWTANDYAAALALLDDIVSGQPKRLTDRGFRVETVMAAALGFVRARLVADVASEIFVEAARDDRSAALTVVLAREAAAADAYRAFVALAANADGAP